MVEEHKQKIRYNRAIIKYAGELRRRCTLSERILWKHLKNKQMLGYDFHRQKPIGNFIYDFYSYTLRLVVELDGYTHLDKDVIENDERKTEYAKAIGFKLLRFKDEEVIENLDKVLQEIRSFIETNFSKI